MKKIIVFTIIILLSISAIASNPKSKGYYFYLQKGFKSSDNLFLWCCDCIMFYARLWDMSYETLNLIIFVFGGPIVIFVLFIWIIIQRIMIIRLKRKLKLCLSPPPSKT
jgi:hypothetical protein